MSKTNTPLPVIGHVTHGSVFEDETLFSPEHGAELKMRADALNALIAWLERGGLTQVQAAKVLGTTQARISDIKRGKIGQFSLDMLVRMAARAGLHPELRLVA